MSPSSDIYTTFDKLLPRAEKERRLGQRSCVIWLYGLSGSGKTTLAQALERKLFEENFFTQILDGDNIRSGLNRDLDFSEEAREENIRRIAEVAKLFAGAGVVTIASFITPFESLRTMAREIVGDTDFIDVYVKCSFEQCAKRDPKGLYAKVLRGEVEHFTGKDSLFEEPKHPSFVIDTEAQDLDASLSDLYNTVIERIRLTHTS